MDVAAELDESSISWQSQVLDSAEIQIKNASEFRKEENLNQIVDFLSGVLLEEIQNDLFPLRGHVPEATVEYSFDDTPNNHTRQRESYIEHRIETHFPSTGPKS